MIGVLIVTHKELAEALLSVTHLIMGHQDGVAAVSLDPNAAPPDSLALIKQGLAQVNNGDGVIILTDMLGGTPSNLSLSFLQKGKVEVVTGVNLPMLLKLSHLREDRSLEEAASMLRQSGQQGITVASEVLCGK